LNTSGLCSSWVKATRRSYQPFSVDAWDGGVLGLQQVTLCWWLNSARVQHWSGKDSCCRWKEPATWQSVFEKANFGGMNICVLNPERMTLYRLKGSWSGLAGHASM
jgi:hypothetical protein